MGGWPARILQLTPDAAAMIGDGFLEVTDPESACVARRLLDEGVANPRPRLLPSMSDVTVIVVLRNDEAGLTRILSALRGHHVVVVDDGSDRPIQVPEKRGRSCRVTVLRHDVPRGAIAARNAGLHAATTEFVAFLDSDVVPRSGWLEVMLGHFSDPAVALVAPRIVALDSESTVLARYQHTRSALDLGRREAAVCADGTVPYVSCSAVLLRRRALVSEGGFAQDSLVPGADLCRQLEQAGWRLRYEPAARVAHDNRQPMRTWFARLMTHGCSAAQLGKRHRRRVSPLAVTRPTVAALALLLTVTWTGLFGAVVPFGLAVWRVRRRHRGLDHPTRLAAIYVARGFGAGLWQVASAMFRHYWPVTLVAVLCSRRVRQVALALALAEGAADWATHRAEGGLDPLRYLAFKRLDDLAYGAGLWRGALRARSLAALTPTLQD
jgi:mycofactocin system glycosyltransferase